MTTKQQRMQDEFQQFLNGAVTAALWSSMPSGPETDEAMHMEYADAYEPAPELRRVLRGVVAHSARTFFIEHYADLADTHLATDRSWDDLGHDFHLTAEGHGTGYWDRQDDDTERAERLTDGARQHEGYLYLYVDANLLLHVDPGNLTEFDDALWPGTEASSELVCVTCALWIANRDDSSAGAGWDRQRVQATLASYAVVVDTDCEHTFRLRDCWCCGDGAAGERVDVDTELRK